jgi:four helix bundle protein
VSLTFPVIEGFELASQLRRAAFSVPVNIVEGYGRRPGADRLNFLQIASASLGEVGYCLHAARRLGYISEEDYEQLDREVRQTASPLRGLMKSLGREHPEEGKQVPGYPIVRGPATRLLSHPAT